jgi:hypothetical protein
MSATPKTGNGTPPPVEPVVQASEDDITHKVVQRLARPRALSLSFGSFGTEEDLLMQIQSRTMDPPSEASQMINRNNTTRPRAGSLSMLFANDDTFLEDYQDAFNVDITLDAFAEVDNLLSSDIEKGNGGLFGNNVQIKSEKKRGADQSDDVNTFKRQRSNSLFGNINNLFGDEDEDPASAFLDSDNLAAFADEGEGNTRGTSRPKVKYCRLCIEPGCTKNAQGATRRCIAHGGGRRCVVDNCTKSAQGTTRKCKAHGGGRRCTFLNCTKSARGSTNKCKAHGGGRRCEAPGCNNSAAGPRPKPGQLDGCITHGGGRKCIIDGCTKSAAGSTPKCKAHGGGRRCVVENCTKSAQGATYKCIAHGGGRRCSVQGCPKSAQGATDRCKTHGGGKRCNADSCNKTVYRATDKCKAHGDSLAKMPAPVVPMSIPMAF